METYTITVKPTDQKGDLQFYSVDARKAKEVMERWDAHQNVQIGDSYISWQRIVEISAPPAYLQLSAPTWCGKCEKGWLFGEGGAFPCSCNASGKEELAKYKSYLEKQEWYIRTIRREAEKSNTDSLFQTADSVFGTYP